MTLMQGTWPITLLGYPATWLSCHRPPDQSFFALALFEDAASF
jgi:hypothetical protein